MIRRSRLRALLLAAALLPACALAAVDTIRVDLEPLIRRAADNPEQFAVEVPRLVSLPTAGSWFAVGGKRTLRYAVSVPGAVSLSFHAARIHLPSSAVLTVSSESTTAIYRSADMPDGSLWSRIHPGNALEFSLEVSAEEHKLVVMDIVGFQAGYRSLSPEIPSHDAYRAYAAGDPDTHCVENYACHITPDNQPSGKATVAVTIANTYLCTGTLVNNTARDNTPYILTARHCAGDVVDTSAAFAPGITVYWNAVSACGEPLGTVLYSPGVRRQTGAKTVYSQQDIWLLKLDAGPVVDDAVLAGFDAGPGEVDGGYSIHHALTYNKQFTRWHGRAARFVMTDEVLLPGPLDLFSVVYEFGVSGPGASGGALFSQEHRVVGVASLAPISRSQSGYGQCPVAMPPAPDPANGSVFFNALSGVWDMRGHGSGGVTLKSLLDPQRTGATFVSGMVSSRLQFSAWGTRPVNTMSMSLQWTSAATSCNASGGVAGDGWAGTLPGSGSKLVSYSGEGNIDYHLVCTLPGAGTVSGSVTLEWTAPVPATYATVNKTVAWPTVPVEFKWKSNYGPCTVGVVDGATLQTDLPAEGALTLTSATPAIVTYRATCGTSGRSSYGNAGVNFMPPVLEMATSAAVRRPGESYDLHWNSYADSCIPTGGSPGDEWNGVARGGKGRARLTVTAMGTFEFGLRCAGGTFTQSRAFQLIVDDSPPYVELLPVRTTVNLAYSPADYIRFTFRSNLADCDRRITGIRTRVVSSPPGEFTPGFPTEGETFFAPDESGAGVVTVTCRPWPYGPDAGGPSVTATLPFTVLAPLAPTASISASHATVTPSDTVTITWSSTSTRVCMLDQLVAGQTSTTYVETAGFTTVKGEGLAPGQWEYRLRCESIDGLQPAASATVRFRVEAATSPPPSGTGGGGGDGGNAGGGGSARLGELVLLGLLWACAYFRRISTRMPGARVPRAECQ